MRIVDIEPSRLEGSVSIPPSKSLAHRAIISAGLAEGVSEIENINFSKDITATTEGMISLGMEVTNKDEKLFIDGSGFINNEDNVTIECNESGSTIRFLIPIAMVKDRESTFTGKGKLVSRPLNTYYEIFDNQNIEYITTNGELPLTVKGNLNSGEFNVRGDISSQFISGLMFALPLLEDDSVINITTELESKGYVDLTLDTLNKFGITIKNDNYKSFYIKGNQKYKSQKYRVEGDFSQAAFWLVAGTLGSAVEAVDLNLESLQGDKAIIEIIEKMGGSILETKEGIKALPTQTHGAVIDVSQCPDLVPVLAVLASLSEGETRIINAERLRIKESDRLAAITSELKKLGANIEELKDGLVINGVDKLTGGEVISHNDHRIAMALAVASTRATGKVTIKDSKCVEKSYPHFFEDFKKLGGIVNEWNVGQ